MKDVKDLPISTQLKPRGDRLVVLPFIKAGSSFLINMEENREKPERGIVVAIGPGGVGAETGKPTPVDAKIGELVCYGKYAGLAFEVAGPDNYPVNVFIMRDSEVLLYQDAGTFEMVMHDNDPRKVHEAGLTCEHCEQVKVNIDVLRDVAYGEPAAAPDPADTEALIASEKDRLVTER